MVSKCKAMNVYLSSCAKDISFCAELSASAYCSHLYRDCIDVVYLLVCKIDNDLIKAVILTPLKRNALMV